MKNKKKLGILVFVAIISLFTVLTVNKGLSINANGKNGAFSKPSLDGTQLGQVKDISDYFSIVTNGATNITDFKQNVRLRAKTDIDRIPDKRNISLPAQELYSAPIEVEPFGFKKLRFVQSGIGSLAETKGQISAVLRGSEAKEPLEFKLSNSDSWIILAVLVNKYKFSFADTQRFTAANGINFNGSSSYNITVNQVLPIGYVKPYPDWGYTFQQYVDYGTDAQFNANVDFNGQVFENLNIREDLATIGQKGIISNYQVDNLDTLRKVGLVPASYAPSININYGASRNMLSIGLFGLYGGKYITGGTKSKPRFANSTSTIEGKLNSAHIVTANPTSKDVDGLGVIDYVEGNTGLSLSFNQGFLVGQAVSNLEISNLNLAGVKIVNTGESSDSKITVNPWEAEEIPEFTGGNQAAVDAATATHNFANNVTLGNTENATSYVVDMSTLTAASTVGGPGFVAGGTRTSITGNIVWDNWASSIGTVATVRGYSIIDSIDIIAASLDGNQIQVGTDIKGSSIIALTAGFLVGYIASNNSDSQISNIDVQNFNALYNQDVQGIEYYGSLHMGIAGGLFGRFEYTPGYLSNIAFNIVNIESRYNNSIQRNSRFNVNEAYLHTRVYGELVHQVGAIAGSFYTVTNHPNALWENFSFTSTSVKFVENSETFDYLNPKRFAGSEQYSAGLIAGKANIINNGTLRNITSDSTSLVQADITNQNYGANSTNSVRFGGLWGYLHSNTNLENIQSDAQVKVNVTNSILSGVQYYGNTNGGAFITSGLGQLSDNKRIIKSVSHGGNVLIKFDTDSSWKNTFTNKGRIYNDLDKAGQTYNFAANMANADSEFYVSGLFVGYLANGGGYAEDITNKGKIILEFTDQQVSVRAFQAEQYLDVTDGGLSRISGVSSYGAYGNTSWINNVSNYGDIFIGGKGIIAAGLVSLDSITTAYNNGDTGKKTESRNINGTDISSFGASVWGGIYSKFGVDLGGVFGASIANGPAAITNIANYGDIRMYSSTVSSVGGIAGNYNDNGTGTMFIANLVNYGNITTYNAYRGWADTYYSYTGSPNWDINNYNDVVRIAGIIGGMTGKNWNNIGFFTNWMNYGIIQDLDQRNAELSHTGNLNTLMDGANSAYKLGVADIIGGRMRCNSYVLDWGGNQNPIKSIILNVGSRPLLTNASAAVTSDTNYVVTEGWSYAYGRAKAQDLAFNAGNNNQLYKNVSGKYLARGGYFMVRNGGSYSWNYTYEKDDPTTQVDENAANAIYLKTSTESYGSNSDPVSINRSFTDWANSQGDYNGWTQTYRGSAPVVYLPYKVQNMMTAGTDIAKYFNGFINGMNGGTYKTQIFNYSSQDTLSYALRNLAYKNSSIVLGERGDEGRQMNRHVWDLTTDAMVPRYVLPFLYGYPYIGTTAGVSNTAYIDMTTAAHRLKLWTKASSNISVGGKEEILANQYYFGDSPAVGTDGTAKLEGPQTEEEISQASYQYNPSWDKSGDTDLTYAKFKQLVNSYYSSPNDYVLDTANYYYSRDNVNWKLATAATDFHKLVIGSYYVRIELASTATYKSLSISSPIPMFYIVNPSTQTISHDSSNPYIYTDSVVVFGDDLYDTWNEYFNMYTREQFAQEISGYNAIKIGTGGTAGYNEVSNISYRQGEFNGDSYDYPTTWTNQPIPSGYYPSGFVNDGQGGVRNVTSIPNLRAGHYEIKITFAGVAPSFDAFFINWEDNGKGSKTAISQTEKIFEFDIQPRDISIDWGVLNGDSSEVTSLDPDQLVFQNNPFNIGAIFHTDVNPALDSSKYASGLSLRYENVLLYTKADPEALMDPDLIGTPKPVELSKVGTYTSIVKFYRGNLDVTSDFGGYVSEFTYTILPRSLVVQWSGETQFMNYTGSTISIKPNINQNNLYQLNSINVDSNLTGLVYVGNEGIDEGPYYAKLSKVIDITGIDITDQLDIYNEFNGVNQPAGFNWRIVPANLLINPKIVDVDLIQSGIQSYFGTKIFKSDFTISESADGVQYKPIDGSNWELLGDSYIALTPGAYQFRSFIDINDEIIASSPVNITVIKANFNLASTIALPNLELGNGKSTASQLELPFNPNGSWTITNPTQSISNVGSYSIAATLEPNDPELYNPSQLSFTFEVISRLPQLELKDDSSLVLDSTSKNIGGIDYSRPVTASSIRTQFKNINNLYIKDANGNTVNGDSNVSLGTGSTVTYGDDVYTIIVYSDIDGNGQCGLEDIESIYNHTSGAITLTGIKLQAADINNDSRVNALDLVASILIDRQEETIVSFRPVASTPLYKREDELL